ncbi:MAG: DNA translocase FtsK [Candidatus Limiplasma sp.]|nr:DNA translocase FtsK [Candidatus Limiplasma sp.]
MNQTKRARAKTYDADHLMFRSILGVLLIGLGVLSVLSILGSVQGVLFTMIRQALQGLGGAFCLGIPFFLLWGGALVAFSAHGRPPVRAFLFILLFYLFGLGLLNLLSKVGDVALMRYVVSYNQNLTPAVADPSGYWPSVTACYRLCSVGGTLGGALGMLTAWPAGTYLTQIGGISVLGVLCLLCILFFTKFDLVGSIRQARQTSDQKMEQRELEKEKKRALKQLKREQAKADAESGAAEAEVPVAATAPTPAPEAARTAYVPQMMPYPAAMPPLNVQMAGAPPMQMPPIGFAPPATNGSTLYDEMIVPEVPDGGTASGWTLKNRLGGQAAAPQTGTASPQETQKHVQPAARTPEDTQGVMRGTMPRDRDSQKVQERMEENRRRKEKIDQRIAQAQPAQSRSGLQPGEKELLDERMSGILQKQANKRNPGAAAAPSQPVVQPPAAPPAAPNAAANPYANPVEPVAQRPNTGTVSQEQWAFTQQVAAYRPPERQAAPAVRADGDRYSAYRKPATADATLMSGTRLDNPALKIPKQDAPARKTATSEPRPYPYPMIELLNLQTQTLPDTTEEDRASARKLELTLESFSIPARVHRVTHGPAVTRFELGLVSSGINVKRIMNIADNIALEMAANGGVRIEVPIPGTTLFGVEVPNREIISVSLAEVLTSPEMTNAKSPLSVALGKDIAGRPVICDLAKMPHLLIAGQTGSGKSVCINSIINSLLFRASPEEVRMIMIDPKVVELQGYNRVPHLLIPVVSDPHKAAGALAWAVQEMLDRYHKMQMKGVREITAYNAKVTGDEPKLPRIVIIIDELSDLMLACKKEVEESIIRLAQLARAAGIHVVVATQRPTVNVITGLIKANIPSRVAFAVASSVDSRTILDMNGAEKLLGRGDMFYFPTGEKAPLRVQGCFVSDAEINAVVDYIGLNSDPDYDESITDIMNAPDPDEADSAGGEVEGAADDRLQEAIEMVLTDGQASISMLQRRMKLGYARAGRLIDDMAARGIVSKSAGSKPREVLISYDQYLNSKDTLFR